LKCARHLRPCEHQPPGASALCVAVVAGCRHQLVGGKLGDVLRGPARQIYGVQGLCRTSAAGVPGRGKVFQRPTSSTLFLLLLCFTLVTGPRRSLNLKLSDTRVCEPLSPGMRLARTSRACRAAISPNYRSFPGDGDVRTSVSFL